MDQGSLYLLLERVGVLANFQLVYSQLAASCSAMAAAVASFQDPKQVCDASSSRPRSAGSHTGVQCTLYPTHAIYNPKQVYGACPLALAWWMQVAATAATAALTNVHKRSQADQNDGVCA